MEIKEAEFNRSDLQAVEEQIYDITTKMKRDAFDLGKAEFHDKYLVQRRAFIKTRLITRLFLFVPITLFVFFVFLAINKMDISNPFLYLLIVLLSVVGAIVAPFLSGELIRLFRCCRKFDTIEQANAYCEHRHVITLQKDEYDTQQSILLLRSRIEYAENKLARLRKDRDVLIEEKEQQEALEREQRRKDGKFVLNPYGYEDLNRETAMEAYTHEVNILTKNISEYERDILFLERREKEVEDAYAKAIKQAKLAVLVYVVTIILQQIFFSKGTISVIITVAIALGFLLAAFVLENKLEKAILDYLVERDSPYIKSYMFCNNLVPIHKQKSEILERLEYDQKSLAEFRERIAYLEN